MREILVGYAEATLERAESIERLRGDLAGFDRTFLGNEPLHRVLTDPGVPYLARRGILTDLLEGKADPLTIALLGFATEVERPGELPSTLVALETLAADALAGGPGAERASGRRATRDRLRGYARRVLEELATHAEIDGVEDELFRFARVLESSGELREALTAPDRPLANRLAILADLLGDRVRPATARLLAYLLGAGRLRDVVGTVDWLVELAAEERGRRIAEVRAAVDLDEDERSRLASALGRLVGRPVEVRVISDPTVVGGTHVAVGDLVIDGTLRLRLERLRDLLASAR